MRWLKSRARPARRPVTPRIEVLSGRVAPAIFATFDPGTGLLTVTGDNLDNAITVSRTAAGKILVNNGAVAVVGGSPTVGNTALIQVIAQDGHDSVLFNQANGPLPAGNLFGGAGNDTLTGGSGGDQLFGEAGNDTLFGKGSPDVLNGGADNDSLLGGDGNDQVAGDLGNDRIVWNPGDDTDVNEGGDGSDTVEVNGGGGAEAFTVTANGTRVRFDRLNPTPFSIDIGTSEALVLNANAGNDSFSATGNLAALIKITVDGAAGNDRLLGSNGIDLLLGGDGNDFIDGQQGNDVAFLGAGNDTFQWDPGDGSDVVEGQAGTDRLLFNGSGGAEIFAASANGGRVLFTRNLGNIVMDLDDVEAIDLNALGSADSVTVNDLAGTDLTKVNVNLAGAIGGKAGDAAADTVIVNGTNGADAIRVLGSAGGYKVAGLSALVTVIRSEGANDTLVVNALGDDDVVTASSLPAGVVKLTVDGGAANDTILGSVGADVFLGGDGEDRVDGDRGADVALLGAGEDTFVWNPGDGNDTVEGQDGADAVIMTGTAAAEAFDLLANGARVLLTRSVDSVIIDVNDVERVDVNTRGGADTVVVGDLTGTDLTNVNVSLAGGGGAADLFADAVVVHGTNGDDVITVTGSPGSLTLTGLAAKVLVTNVEPARDTVTVNALAGADVVDASSLKAGATRLTTNGGLGNDIFVGSEGNDFFNGGDGNDTAFMSAGDDTFVWNPGDDNDTLEGQAGFDTMLFNGANVAESIDISANGGRVIFFRDIANVVMDLNDVEGIDFNALGGADAVVVNDLSGTDVTEIKLNLAGPGGAGDGAADSVVVRGTSGNDLVQVAGGAGGLSVTGLAARVRITKSEGALDRLTVNALDGDDRVNAALLAAGAIRYTADGGAGNDTLVGSAGADELIGGIGDDRLVGGPGVDVLNAAPGNDVVIQ